MADFSTVLKGTRFNYSYRCCEKFIFYLKLWQTDVTTIDFILLSHKYSNLFKSSSLSVFSRFNICRTINSSPNQEKNREISTRKQWLKKKNN